MQIDIADIPNRLRRSVRDAVLVKDDAQRQIGLNAIDAFEQVVRGMSLTPQSLDTIAAAMGSSETMVSVSAAELLSILAPTHEPARDLICRLSHDGNEHARFAARAAATWQGNLPSAFVGDVLRVGMSDPSLKLRMDAACDAARLGIGELVPAMLALRQTLAVSETAECTDATAWLDLYIDLARDGYSLELLSEMEANDLRRGSDDAAERFQGEVYLVKVRLEGRQSMTGGYASEADLRTRGAAVIAEEIRQRFLEGERRRFDT